MIKHLFTILTGCLICAFTVSGQSFPTSQNLWSNPDFVDRFLGSYGVRTEVEPSISEDEAALFQELVELIQNEQTPLAITRLETYIQENTTEESQPSPALTFTLGNMLLQENQLERAITAYREAITDFPNFLRAYKNLGLALIRQGDFEEATGVIVKSIELGEANGDTFGLLGYCYLNLGQYGPALEAYRQATLLNPENREWFVGKAEALMRTEKYREAIATFEYLIGLDGSKDAYYTSMANAYISLGEPMEAAKLLEVIYRTGNPDVPVLNLLGDIYLNNSMPKLAMRPYLDLFNAEGTVSSARIIRTAKALMQRSFYPDAEAFLDRAERYLEGGEGLEEARSEFLNLRAELALGQGQSKEAARILEEVVEIEPMNGNALLLLGNYYFREGDYEEAEYYFDRASRIDAVAVDALIQSARLNVQKKDYRTAIERLEDAQALDYQRNVQEYLEAVESVYERTR
ncbi:MAG: tetratricopeptide repeat protein [Oceanipulchritudo sp.]